MGIDVLIQNQALKHGLEEDEKMSISLESRAFTICACTMGRNFEAKM